jgi:cellulose synthase/poly-beta-1,6-N-acetylglucosamine synthase-like glycosyltransferase
MSAARRVMWGSLGLLAWTHVGYPLAVAGLARIRRYRARQDDAFAPGVSLIITAHNEEGVIAERLENALAQDYPQERVEIVVASDGSTDGTGERVAGFADRGVHLLELPRGGKVAAQNAAVAATKAEVVAFSDANSLWEPDALRALVRNLADGDVGYVCGRVDVDGAEGGDSRESLYWRYELWLREQESACGSITAGNGGIYAVRRSAFLALEPEHSHDLGLPFRLRRRGLRSVYEPAAVAHEPALRTTRAEGTRKVRMLSRAWWEVLRGGLLDPRGQPPLYFVSLVSHRVLRYAGAPLHALLFLASVRLSGHDPSARALLLAQLGFAGLALAGRRRPELPVAGAAWYYAVMTDASAAGLWHALTRGPHVTWAPNRDQ